MANNFLRTPGLNSQFPPIYIDAAYDLPQIYISTGFILAVLVLIALMPTFQWRSAAAPRAYAFGILFLYVGWALLFSIYGYEWQSGGVSTQVQYAPGSPDFVQVDLQLRIGLYGFNVTCLGTPKQQNNWTIDWNEHYSWSYPHHREREEFGVPYPVQAISEYMTLDGEYFRWGRHFRQAGMFTFFQSRTAFGIWLVALALFAIKAQSSAANTLVVLAILQASACITYYCITSTLPLPQPDAYANINPFRAGANQNLLAIPFKDGVLTPRLSASYGIAWSAAIVSLLLGVFANPRFVRKSSSENPEITAMVVEWERRHFAHSKSHKSLDSISTL
ncbi:hypothetical protein HDU83_008217 [Entophlyctis luteolus]|nr:hypothetical protein HDU82_001650 [Entophlyctis luteolus]KAJ3352286.1 hypothetical protein HDU83_008217 [Entophlyctis luteolus]